MEKEYTFSKFEQACRKYPDNNAVIFLGHKFSYSRLHTLVNKFASGLAEQGVRKGDRIVIYLANCIQFVIAFLAAQKLGAVTVLVSPIYTSREIDYMIKDSRAETIICHDTNFGYVRDIFSGSSLKRIIVTRLLDMLPLTKRKLAALFDRAPHGKVVRSPETLFFKDLLKSDSSVPVVDIDPHGDLSYILYTGGTTGFPKGVPGNHSGHTSYVNDVTEDVIGEHSRKGSDTYIAVNPLFHIMRPGPFHGSGPEPGQYDSPHANTPNRCHTGGMSKVSCSLVVGCTNFVSYDPGERQARLL